MSIFYAKNEGGGIWKAEQNVPPEKPTSGKS